MSEINNCFLLDREWGLQAQKFEIQFSHIKQDSLDNIFEELSFAETKE